MAYNPEDLELITKSGLDASRNTQIMLEQSVLGWKEYELEVMRDKKDVITSYSIHYTKLYEIPHGRRNPEFPETDIDCFLLLQTENIPKAEADHYGR